ncbi:acyl-ACP thioesterase domain-containing protein [Pseudoflavonifractor sp. An85]|uniref:acyl-[acyl-carrier-protein] thioesterase n=1 Tax=Pseudoflavonifractor sp. An85 TaxID=1965661 RepID=UPI000B366C48|nr:acyl-ACP thioesterase domain-containing protein [Pseudoflavonifractor sp. An85]OUN25972.1 hypothetical protein B5G37_01720 [Pseudoflavonifractor sp. An85]
MSKITEVTFRVDSLDVDMFNQCRPSAVLGYLQEAATQAAIELGASGPEILEKYNCLWMVSRNWVELDAPLRWNEEFTIQTWHRGGTGVATYRDFDIFRDGVRIGQAVAQWVMVDADTHKLYRMRDVTEFQGTDGGERKKSIKLHRVPMPKEFSVAGKRYLGYSDTDINGHINNIHYADYACDALHLEQHGKGKFVREFQISYIGECRAGEELTMETEMEDNHLYARGVGPEGDARFEYALTLAEQG